ncbi:SDR family NAD(P)-dependent oxidoreductase [Paraburkholderia sp. D15]|uniref:SDR family oxidoreductase n=1 Tax=Paraburkholderia sp. D15 TaxID=2880218 RepID=UPI00247B1B93|nr:SDR family NAD(P)-dependent oxidoreductase [Paraburkholderia sp. D15]WGS53780.1 SDR family NAD(P)-dependent oxidoreductase [Paraburkholderia sp. D15]
MEMTGNTILITGGGSGIGRGLAEAFHRAGNQVIIAGRRVDLLESVAVANPGMKTAMLDVNDEASVARFADATARDYPALNVLINNAGIMKAENWLEDTVDTKIAGDTIHTNLLAPIQLTAALLPQLRKQSRATIMTVTSGLAYLTMAATPSYCATKAAMHAFGDALRYQLRETNVDVLEIAPPYVQTELMGEHQASDPHAMPLDAFIAEVMALLAARADDQEILVERVRPLRFAAEQGQQKYRQQFAAFNDAMAARR